MALQKLISDACDELTARGGVFTEIDIVNEANVKGQFSTALFKQALRAANTLVGTRFRERKLARYGPVFVPGLPEPDFARIASKIAYASAIHGPAVFVGPNNEKCPNGQFSKLMLEDVPAPLNRKGRRVGTKRNDLKPWSEQRQELRVIVAVDANATDPSILELQANLNAANARVEGLEHENHRLRAHKATPPDDGAVLELLGEFESRLATVEQTIEQLARGERIA